MPWKTYLRTNIAQMRPYVPGKALHPRVSISTKDIENGSPKAGDMIARNPDNHDDQWLVSAEYFTKNFEEIIVDSSPAENVRPIGEGEFKIEPHDIVIAVDPRTRPLDFRLQNPFDDSMDVTAEGRDYDHVVITLRRVHCKAIEKV